MAMISAGSFALRRDFRVLMAVSVAPRQAAIVELDSLRQDMMQVTMSSKFSFTPVIFKSTMKSAKQPINVFCMASRSLTDG